jgi:valyl-tRNA synthetase
MNVPPSRKAKLYIVSSYPETFNDRVSVFFQRLASASEVEYVNSYADESAIQLVTDSATAYIPLADMIDTEKELARLNKEKDNILGEIARLEKKLSNEGFVAKAPAAVVDGEKAKLAKYRETLAGVEGAIAQLPKAN